MLKKWWNNGIVYQIYPKSFSDSNGDGIGDLKGIIGKLDYLQYLGVNIIWISPVYQSPMKDNGYDISDYYSIDPQFGTMEHMEQLIKEVEKRGMRVLMDLVINHCSSEHKWFKQAMENPTGPYGEYFIIKSGKAGMPPNNWRSIFGGSVWEAIANTDLYYFHTFAKEQPDLNWENENLRKEIYKMICFWLDKGLGGFRVDAITYIKKEETFRSLPADGADGLVGLQLVAENYPGIEKFLKELKENTFDRYDAFTVAEMAGVSNDMLHQYIGENGLFSSIFDFSYMDLDVAGGLWCDKREVTAEKIKQEMFPSQQTAADINGYLSVVLGNHDQPRSISKLVKDEHIGYESGTMLATMNLLLRGIPFIYQGDEIGMKNIKWSTIEEVDDIQSHDQYQRALLEGHSESDAMDMVNRRSRDHSRTPMQWSNTVHGGFTEGNPWLPVNTDNIEEINVESQQKSEKSILQYYRNLIKLRNSEKYKDILLYGRCIPYHLNAQGIIAYERIWKKEKIVVLLNFTGEYKKIQLEKGDKKLLIGNYDRPILAEQTALRAYEAVVYEV